MLAIKREIYLEAVLKLKKNVTPSVPTAVREVRPALTATWTTLNISSRLDS